jgi:hypothetical protein
MNNRLLSTIWQARMQTKPLTPNALPSFGLHVSDVAFFGALLDHLEVDLPLRVPCCSWCM